MPEFSTLMIAVGGWLLLFAFVWALCAAAGRADAAGERAIPATPGRTTAAQPVVVDMGGIRAHLRAGATLIDAEQLTVTADVGGTEVVLASSRAVVEAIAGTWPELTAPVRLGSGAPATLRALRRPGSEPFDDADRALVDALAARVSGTLEIAHPSASANIVRRNALA